MSYYIDNYVNDKLNSYFGFNFGMLLCDFCIIILRERDILFFFYCYKIG